MSPKLTSNLTAIKTDHSAVFLEIDSLADHPRGPSFWTYNNSLLDDPTFVQGLRENFALWLKEISFCDDLRVKWNWIKYRIRQESMTYSKLKAKERKAKMKTIEDRLKLCEEKIADAPTPENLINLESVRSEYEREFDYVVRGSIIRSCATWYEQGERNTKYFLNLEDNNKKKSCIWKLLQSDGKETSDANVILNEIYNFYSDLYNENLEIQTDFRGCPFLKNPSMIPKLSDAMREACDGQLSYSECFKVLSTFENNKSPGNDGLSIEFHKFSWPENWHSLS